MTNWLYCRTCHTRILRVPFSALWTGVVARAPEEPDPLIYVPCRRCKNVNRFEITPPEDSAKSGIAYESDVPHIAA
jgi:RNase P subunit RPR2